MRKQKMIIIAVAGMFMTMSFSAQALAADNVSINIEDTGVLAEHSILDNSVGVPYPTDIRLQEQGNQHYLYKTYVVPADYKPENLIEEVFTQGGYRYHHSETILQDQTPGRSAKVVNETKTGTSETNERTAILAMMGEKMSYSDEEGYHGELLIVPESLNISETGRSNYSYTVYDVREYLGLERNDPAYVPKFVNKDGYTLALQNIDWIASDYLDAGYSLIPNSYTATATYSIPVTGTKINGYAATVLYSGEVYKEIIGKNTITIVYEGEQIIVPFNFVPLIIAGVILVGGIVTTVLLWRLRKNIGIYVYQQGVPKLYRRERIRWQNPTLELVQLSNVQVRLVLNKKLAQQLENQLLFVIGRYSNLRFPTNGEEIQEIWIGGKGDSETGLPDSKENSGNLEQKGRIDQ